MGRLLGLMLFCIGIGMVIGMLIAESAGQREQNSECRRIGQEKTVFLEVFSA